MQSSTLEIGPDAPGAHVPIYMRNSNTPHRLLAEPKQKRVVHQRHLGCWPSTTVRGEYGNHHRNGRVRWLPQLGLTLSQSTRGMTGILAIKGVHYWSEPAL